MLILPNKLIYFLFLLLPFSLVSGPFLPDLSISIMGIIVIYNFAKNDFNKNYFINSKIPSKETIDKQIIREIKKKKLDRGIF